MIFLTLFLSVVSFADIKLNQLPIANPALVGVNDTVPFSNVTDGNSYRFKLSLITSLPAFSTYNAPTATLAASATLAAAATALAASPTTCGGSNFAKGVDTMGNAICAAPPGVGSSGLTVSTIAVSGTLVVGSPVNYQHIACNAAGGAVVATVPACAGNIGQVFNLKKIDSSGNSCSYLRSGGDLLDGATSLVIPDQYVGISIVCRAAGFWDVL